MRHWSQIAIKSWRAKPGRTAGAIAAIALGVGVVVWVTCTYESVKRSLEQQVWTWIGESHLTLESMWGHRGFIPRSLTRRLTNLDVILARAEYRPAVIDALDEGSLSPEVRAVLRANGVRLSDEAEVFVENAGVGWRIRDGVRDYRLRKEHGRLAITLLDPIESIAERYIPRLQASAEPDGGTTSQPAIAVECDAIGIQVETEYAFRNYEELRISGRVLTPADEHACMIEDALADELGLSLGDAVHVRLPRSTENPAYDKEGAPVAWTAFRIVGTIRYRRLARFQPPVIVMPLETLLPIAPTKEAGARVTSIDIRLKDRRILLEPGISRRVTRHIQALARTAGPDVQLSTAQAKLRQVRAAQDQTQLVLMLIASVALFTAFFIILSTLSMGMIERIVQMGMLRCLGMTRLQLAGLVLAEVVPVGVLGILLGIPVGLAFAAVSVLVVPDYLGAFAIDWTGVGVAVAGGGLTALAGAALPAVRAMRVTPLEATRPQARPGRWYGEVVAALVGAAMIFGHDRMIVQLDLADWLRWESPVLAVMLIYCGYALITPLAIRIASFVIVPLAARVFRLRPRLLRDQIGRVTWRAAGICCGLMVGLSLIVCLVVHSESVVKGWDFPSQLADAFVWNRNEGVPRQRAEEILAAVTLNQAFKQTGHADTLEKIMGGDEALRAQLGLALAGETDGLPRPFVEVAERFERVRPLEARPAEEFERILALVPRVAGIREITHINHISGWISAPRLKTWGKLWSQFIAGDPRTFFQMAEVNFVDCGKPDDEDGGCDLEEVLTRLRETRGGVLITAEFARVRGVNVGDKLLFYKSAISAVLSRGHSTFEVVAIVEAPGLNIAASYFQAAGQLTMAATTAVIGTLDDADDFLNFDDVRTFLLDFDLPDEPAPPDFAAQDVRELTREFEGGGLAFVDPASMDAKQRWRWVREQRVLRDLTDAAGIDSAIWGSVRSLKDAISTEIGKATLLFTTVPAVALIVAALGVGNLMMANVASRAKQIAVLRAVGSTQWQIMRLVLAEAVVLGALGSVIGVGLGLHMADSINRMTLKMRFFEPQMAIPWDQVLAGVALTTGICIVAGLGPARHAARSNIAGALQTT